MRQNNEILECYQQIGREPEEVTLWLEKIEYLAQNNQKNFSDLIDLFDSLPEKTVSDIDDKLLLSDIFVNLKFKPIKSFFMRIIKNPKEEVWKNIYNQKWTSRDNKIWAAGNLIKMDDAQGKEFLIGFIPEMDSEEKEYLVELLAECENKFGIKFFLDLSEKYEFVNNYINTHLDRVELENKLQAPDVPTPL